MPFSDPPCSCYFCKMERAIGAGSVILPAEEQTMIEAPAPLYVSGAQVEISFNNGETWTQIGSDETGRTIELAPTFDTDRTAPLFLTDPTIAPAASLWRAGVLDGLAQLQERAEAAEKLAADYAITVEADAGLISRKHARIVELERERATLTQERDNLAKAYDRKVDDERRAEAEVAGLAVLTELADPDLTLAEMKRRAQTIAYIITKSAGA